MTVLRGIGAIVLCFVVVSALSFGVDGILHATGVFPPWGQPMAGHLFTLALAYRIVFHVRDVVRRPPRPRAALALGLDQRRDRIRLQPLWHHRHRAAGVAARPLVVPHRLDRERPVDDLGRRPTRHPEVAVTRLKQAAKA